MLRCQTKLHFRGFIKDFSRKTTGFHGQAELFELNVIIKRKNFLKMLKTRQAQALSQPVSLPSAWPKRNSGIYSKLNSTQLNSTYNSNSRKLITPAF